VNLEGSRAVMKRNLSSTGGSRVWRADGPLVKRRIAVAKVHKATKTALPN
jgi:hypothetical protein